MARSSRSLDSSLCVSPVSEVIDAHSRGKYPSIEGVDDAHADILHLVRWMGQFEQQRIREPANYGQGAYGHGNEHWRQALVWTKAHTN